MPVPHPTDETDANTLPDPELNPLLNPLLAAHMGRWAEVYFTAPPEKREQAVSDLLRELKNDFPPEPAPDQVLNHVIHDEKIEKRAEKEEVPDSSAAVAEPVLVCNVCAHQNAAGQLFCGMCGSHLQVQRETVTPQVVEAAPVSEAHWNEPEPSAHDNSPQYANEPERSSIVAAIEHDAPESAWTLPDRGLPHFALEPEPESVPYRYRPYVGVVLAVLLLLLVYMAWRGTQAISGTAGKPPGVSRTNPPAPSAGPAAAAASAQPGTTDGASSEAKPAQPSATGNASPETTAPPSPVRTNDRPAPVSRKAPHSKTAQSSARRASPIITMAANSTALSADASGAEELASAERYLNGTQGTPRDPREAVQLLWKAEGKGNLAATIALSDLYLRGDGVPKSCDQARLLLDAAARKGARAAAERLRNLQAFGCN
jgi:hypothetical protein